MSDLRPESPPASAEDVLERLIREVETQAPVGSDADRPPTEMPQAEVIKPGETGGQTSLGGLLNGVLSNPALLSALPQLLNGLGALSKGAGAAQQTAAAPTAAPSTPTGNGGGAPLTAIRIPHLDRHTALLCAIKPYLGTSRQQAADYLINLCRVWNTLQGMGLNLPALLLPSSGKIDGDQEKEV